MKRDEIKAHVSSAVELSWADFTRDHPALAQAIDRETLNIIVVESLARDAEFVQAYERAVSTAAAAGALSELINRFAGIILRRLK